MKKTSDELLKVLEAAFKELREGEEISGRAGRFVSILKKLKLKEPGCAKGIFSAAEDLASLLIMGDLKENTALNVQAREVANDLLINIYKCVDAQDPIDNVNKNPELKNNPAFAKFFEALKKVVDNIRAIEKNPAAVDASKCFNQENAKNLANLIIELVKIA